MNYEARPDGRFKPLTPYDWPQDTLREPNGYGQMPRVSILNQKLTEREFFSYNTTFTAVPNTTKYQAVNIIPTDDDGDFWFDNVICVNTGPTAGVGYAPLWGRLQIEDVTNNYKLFPNNGSQLGIPLSAIEPNYDVTGFTPPGYTPTLAGQRASFIQPYCFLRGCGIKITLSLTGVINPAPLPASVTYYVNLVGWKEYANAAT